MHKTFLTFAALSLPLLASAATPARAGFDPAVVPADAQWVLYLDLATLRGSALGREMMAAIPKFDMKSEDMPISVNIPKIIESLTSATAYGTNLSNKPEDLDGALVIRGSDDLRKIVQAFLISASVEGDGKGTDFQVKELTDLGFEGYAIHDEVIVALPPGDAILVSKSRDRLAAAHALLKNDKSSMARSRSAALSALIPKGGASYLLAASVVPRGDFMPTEGPQARILQMASAASVSLGESGSMTTARIQIDAASSDMADRLVKILQGFAAMLSFAESDDAGLAEFLRSVKVERTASGALLNLAYPTDRLVQMLQTLRQKEEQKQEHRREARVSRVSKPASVEGRVVAEWVANKDLASDRASADNIVTHTVENVSLATGAMIWLNSNRHEGENGRFDYIDIAPTRGGGAPIRFEAENMRLNNYAVEEAGFASGGELIVLNRGSGSARFVFPGTPGDYTLTIAYVDETDGQSAFSVSITDPKPQPGPETAPVSRP